MSKTYTVGGKPIEPIGGHVAIVEIKDPMILQTADSPLRIVKDKWMGLCIGRVIAVDAKMPDHFVVVGDVVEFPSGHRTAIINADGGVEVMLVREAMLSFKISGIPEEATKAPEVSAIQPPAKPALNAGVSRSTGPQPAKIWTPKEALVSQ